MKPMLLTSFMFLLFVGCKQVELAEETSQIDTINYDILVNGYVSSNEVLQRAYQMASVEWTPISPVPFRTGIPYESGKPVKGIPYSSVKEINTYLFQDVSYHTFMTAVHNPNSVFYTEDISKPPYHGVNCATYYGAVCSSSVMYALGFKIPFSTNQIIKLPFMRKIEHQVIDSLKICDVIWKKGHVQLIYNIEFKADTLYKVTTFETTGRKSRITSYSPERFRKLWNNNGYVGYRYEYLNYSSEPAEFKKLGPIQYNDDLCPSKGDKAVYRTDDTITINIFNPNYDEIVLMKDGREVLREACNGDKHQFFNLQPGIFSVYLQKEDAKTEPVTFEAMEIYVNYIMDNGDKDMIVYFNPLHRAEYVALCTLQGGSQFYPISNRDREQGFTKVPFVENSYNYCKVIFSGEYGSITNRPIRVM